MASITISFEISNPNRLYMARGTAIVVIGGVEIYRANMQFSDPTAEHESGSFALYPNFTEPGTLPSSVTIEVEDTSGRVFSDTVQFTIVVSKVTDNKPSTPIADPNNYYYTGTSGSYVRHELHWSESVSPIGAIITYYVSSPTGSTVATTATSRTVSLRFPNMGQTAQYTWSVYAYDSYGNKSEASVSGVISLITELDF